MVIDRWETDFGMVNITLDWKIINKISDKIEKSKEIRRQRWIHILMNETQYEDVRDLINDLKENGITIQDFSKDVADGYDLVSDTIKSVIKQRHSKSYVTTEKKRVNRSIEILIKDTEFDVGKELKLK